MSKKNLKQGSNLPRVTINKVTKPNENNELRNKILKGSKEERQKIFENMIFEDYPFWLYMRKNLPNDYFISGKNDISNGEDGNEISFVQSGIHHGQFKGKMNLNGVNGLKAKNKHANNTLARNIKRPFPKTLEGMEKEFDELKGKTLTYHEQLRKKGLYSRIIKKKRKEERTKLKDGIKSNLAVEKKGNKIKIKPIKRVFNNEGKVVSSKFDFTETEIIKTPNKISKITLNSDHSKANKIVTNRGKKRQNNELNGNFSLVSNDVNKEKKTKIMNSQVDSEIEHSKEQIKLPFEPVFNKESKMVFSKFEFSENKNKRKKKEKDTKKILEKLKEKEENLKELEASGSKDKAMEIKEREKWAVALKKASGEKVKDDPELLKKSLRKEKHKKSHSKKKWETRVADVLKSKQEKQQKRSDNIGARKTEKKKKKMKRAIKRGRYVP